MDLIRAIELPMTVSTGCSMPVLSRLEAVEGKSTFDQ